MNVWLAGFFACAALYYGVHWWNSRQERVLLVFAVQCVAYVVFCLAIVQYFRARTIPDTQLALNRFVSIGVLIHAVAVQFYADLGGRRDRLFRALLAGLFVFLAVLNHWVPLRGTVIALQAVQLPGGTTGVIPVRTPPGAPLALLYGAALVLYGYGILVAGGLWKRNRAGAALVGVGSTGILVTAALGVLIDFANLRAPYLGAWPHAFFVLCMTLFLAREYAARGAEVRAHRERLEELVATRTRELSTAKEEAERANHAKSLFLAHVSHEIRNPLHAIQAYAQLLERDPLLGDAQRTKAGIVSSSGKHLQTLINDLLEMSKIEAGRLELVEAPFDPGAVLVDVERMFAVEAAAKAIQLTIEGAAQLPSSVIADGAKVKQILINLASNALKFTRRGSIRFQASSSPLANGSIRVEIVVVDTGIGIAAQDATRLFQPFQQLDAGKRAGGTGLGLAISLAHARLMGGELSAESAPGVGSAFKFSYLAKRTELDANAPARESNGPVTPSETRRKALIVDDVAINRDILAELLREPGFETRTAADGESALSIHAHWLPDLVLVDLRMPGIGGLEAIRQMKGSGSRAAIGALTACALADDERRARAFGADFFLRKPYDYGELLNEIERCLGAAAAAGEPDSRC